MATIFGIGQGYVLYDYFALANGITYTIPTDEIWIGNGTGDSGSAMNGSATIFSTPIAGGINIKLYTFGANAGSTVSSTGGAIQVIASRYKKVTINTL